jgi:hypothetical protein
MTKVTVVEKDTSRSTGWARPVEPAKAAPVVVEKDTSRSTGWARPVEPAKAAPPAVPSPALSTAAASPAVPSPALSTAAASVPAEDIRGGWDCDLAEGTEVEVAVFVKMKAPLRDEVNESWVTSLAESVTLFKDEVASIDNVETSTVEVKVRLPRGVRVLTF